MSHFFENGSKNYFLQLLILMKVFLFFLETTLVEVVEVEEDLH